MRIAVTGASGLVGSALVPALKERGHQVVRLVRRRPETADETAWDPVEGVLDVRSLEGVGAIVHLAGENIGQRWSNSKRRAIRDSRVNGTRLVAETVAALESRPALLCASAVGYYGQRGDAELTEEASRGDGYLAEVVGAWESAADPARDAGARVVHFRQAPIVAGSEGMLRRMLLPFRLGLGGRVGSGEQWWSWVAIDDVVSAYLLALEKPFAGAYNLVAPEVVRNRVFVETLGDVLHRPTVFPLPGAAVRLVWGDMGEEMLLGGQRAVPERLRAEGFEFAYPSLRQALAHVLRG